jgi:3-oxoacyl-[acyl-carrier-protein] synthase-1
MTPLHLTALGIATAIGCGKRRVAERLFGRPESGLVERKGLIPGVTAWVGAVAESLPEIPAPLRRFACRNNRLTALALEEIETEIAAARRRYGPDRIAVVLGTSTSGIAEGESALAARLSSGAWLSGYDYAQQEPGNLAAFAAELLGLSGPAYTIHTACSSSGKAFASAARLIRAGLCDAALVGGVDTLCGLTLNGFHALGALSPERCNPFSRNREGTSIGEGAAIFVLEPSSGPVALLSVGESSDAHHVSAPEPSGIGARLAMTRGLAAAGLSPEAIGYVNLHGTATPLNDAMEGRAVAGLFGAATPCSSTKGLTGHALGAAGAVEAAFLWLALADQYGAGLLPPHLWDGVGDPEIPPLDLVEPGRRLRDRSLAMLSNSFAFGGSNVSVVLGRGAAA